MISPRLGFLLVSSVLAVTQVEAHMSMWHPSMYGVGPNWGADSTLPNPANPIGPDIPNQKDWWFRGPESRALKPRNGSVMDLPAGGKVDIEIACNVAFTSGVPGEEVDDDLLSGCALAIADKDDIEKVGWDDLVVFSVNQRCVKDRVTTFEIPERLPQCSGSKCICGWFWLANNGTGNMYMTGFDCSVSPSENSAPILSPNDPIFCPSTNSTCTPTKGAKRPLYAYNSPSNIIWQGNDNRPGYHDSWSFKNGAQNDIFETEKQISSPNARTSTESSKHTEIESTLDSSTATAIWTKASIVHSSFAQPPSKSVTLNQFPSSSTSAPLQKSSTTSTSIRSFSTTSIAESLRQPSSPFPTDSVQLSYSSFVSIQSRTPFPTQSIGKALKLSLPSFDGGEEELKRRHVPTTHDRNRSRRTSITDELLDTSEESQASVACRGGISFFLLFIVLCISSLLYN
ncbi:hypothetical protein JCM5350_003559 [Sporobolomyces pararoseus]